MDYRIESDSSRHNFFQVLAAIMIIVYPIIGIIRLFYACLLFSNKRVLKDGGKSETRERVQPMGDLWKPYKPEKFYYEVIGCLRRILLTGVVVFIYPGTAAQVAVTLVISFALFVVSSDRLSPYNLKLDSGISLVGHIMVFMSMYIALLNKVDVSDEHSSSQAILAWILVIV